MSFIRGHEPAEHAYVKNIIKEMCHKYGWIVGEEVVLPNGTRVDIVAIKDEKLKLIEVATKQMYRGRRGDRRSKLEQYGELMLITYEVGKAPDRKAVEMKVIELLRGKLK